MSVKKSAFSELGVPLAPDKVLGPASTMTYLGIEINNVASTIQLPEDKFNELQFLLKKWM